MEHKKIRTFMHFFSIVATAAKIWKRKTPQKNHKIAHMTNELYSGTSKAKYILIFNFKVSLQF